MEKIKMLTPLVEMDGDEMTRILWQWIKDILICPFVDLKTEYYDLGLVERDKTDDKVTSDSAIATKKYGVAVKCATITPNAQRVEEYNLKKMYKSPNGTIRAMLDGTVFRAPILVDGITPYIPTWKKPIVIARHAYGDIYKAVDGLAGEGKAELVFTDRDGKVTTKTIHDFNGDGVVMAMHNTDKSIESFARACFNYALDMKLPLWFSTKDTISKVYDGNFKAIFEQKEFLSDLFFDNGEAEEKSQPEAHFWDEEGESNEEYEEFTEKFKPKLTTDDCYTPGNIYECVKNWAVKRYGLEGREVVRPFFPGGDYEKHDYPAGCVVIDNPPFSILSDICGFYQERSIDFLLFAPALTLFSTNGGKCNYLPVGTTVTYENGAKGATSFVTNLGEFKIETAPDLYEELMEEDEKNRENVERIKNYLAVNGAKQ